MAFLSPDTRVLNIRDFRNFIIAKFCLTFATRTLAVMVGWTVYEYTHNAFSLGLIGLSEAIPFLITAFFAGHVADVVPRKSIVMVCSIGYLLCAIGLLLVRWQFAWVTSQAGLIPVYLLIFLTGIVRGFYAPAHGSFAAQLIPRDLMVYASVWNSISFDISAVSGPAIGGLVYAFAGPIAAFGLVVVFASAACILFARVAPRPLPDQTRREPMMQSLREGLRFVFTTQELVGAFALDMFAVLFGGAVALLPAFASQILMCGPQGLGYLQAAPALGAILTSLVLASHPPRRHAGRKMLFAIAGFGLCMMGFALSTTFWLSWLFLFLSGVCDEVSVIVRSTIVQLFAPEHLRGRVEAVSKIFIGSSNEIGAFESGTAASLLGLRRSVLAGAGVTLLVVGTAWHRLPRIRNLHFSTSGIAGEKK